MRPSTRFLAAAVLFTLAGCASQPFETEPPSPTQAPPESGRGPSLPPPPEPGSADPTIEAPAPAPLPKERPKVAPATLSPASKALVSQAQTQRNKGDLPGATISLERALRIEPRNPLLWIEMGRLRMDQRNFTQAEAMGRKALSVAIGDDRSQSQAWALISDASRLGALGFSPRVSLSEGIDCYLDWVRAQGPIAEYFARAERVLRRRQVVKRAAR